MEPQNERAVEWNSPSEAEKPPQGLANHVENTIIDEWKWTCHWNMGPQNEK
jgi:hypothetical protein